MRTNLSSRGVIRPASNGSDFLSKLYAEKRMFSALLKRVREIDKDFQPNGFLSWQSKDSAIAITEMRNIINNADPRTEEERYDDEHAQDMEQQHRDLLSTV